MGQNASEFKQRAKPSSSAFQNNLVAKMKDKNFKKSLSNEKFIRKTDFREGINSRHLKYPENNSEFKNYKTKAQNCLLQSKDIQKSCFEINLSGIKQSDAQYEEQELKKTIHHTSDKQKQNQIQQLKKLTSPSQNIYQNQLINQNHLQKTQKNQENQSHPEPIFEKNIKISQNQQSNLILHVESRLPSSNYSHKQKSTISFLTSNMKQTEQAKYDYQGNNNFVKQEKAKHFKKSTNLNHINEVLFKSSRKTFVSQINNSKITDNQSVESMDLGGYQNRSKEFHNLVNKIINTKSYQEDPQKKSSFHERKSLKHRSRLEKCISLGKIKSKITLTDNKLFATTRNNTQNIQFNIINTQNDKLKKQQKQKKIFLSFLQSQQNYFNQDCERNNLTNAPLKVQKQPKRKNTFKDLNLIIFSQIKQEEPIEKTVKHKFKNKGSEKQFQQSLKSCKSLKIQSSFETKKNFSSNNLNKQVKKSKLNDISGKISEKQRNKYGVLYKVKLSESLQQNNCTNFNQHEKNDQNLKNYKKIVQKYSQYNQPIQVKLSSHKAYKNINNQNLTQTQTQYMMNQNQKYQNQSLLQIKTNIQFNNTNNQSRSSTLLKSQNHQKSHTNLINSNLIKNKCFSNNKEPIIKNETQNETHFSVKMYHSGRVQKLLNKAKKETTSLQKVIDKANLSKSLTRTNLSRSMSNKALIAF